MLLLFHKISTSSSRTLELRSCLAITSRGSSPSFWILDASKLAMISRTLFVLRLIARFGSSIFSKYPLSNFMACDLTTHSPRKGMPKHLTSVLGAPLSVATAIILALYICLKFPWRVGGLSRDSFDIRELLLNSRVCSLSACIVANVSFCAMVLIVTFIFLIGSVSREIINLSKAMTIRSSPRSGLCISVK